MLQQTTVAAVAPRFERFLARWPTVETLAAAPDSEVLGEWAGLGYYARARNLITCARLVADRGGFPATEAELATLPGIGAYTAAAIAAIAFQEPAAVVDTNVTRVIARLYQLERPPLPDIRQRVATLTPADRPGDFAQAMMDLGATICTPKKPACSACPLVTDCAAFAAGDPERYPAPRQKQAKPLRRGVAHWIEADGKLWLVRRPAKGLLGGMAALPGSDWTPDCPAAPAPLATIRHVFTHFALDLDIVADRDAAGDGWWQPIDTLDRAGLPSLYAKAVKAVISGRHALAA